MDDPNNNGAFPSMDFKLWKDNWDLQDNNKLQRIFDWHNSFSLW